MTREEEKEEQQEGDEENEKDILQKEIESWKKTCFQISFSPSPDSVVLVLMHYLKR
jgi:hypothetical protein